MFYNKELIDWEKIKLVILDVDGTLYNQKKLRKIMFFKILKFYISRPFYWREVMILIEYRKQRERNALFSHSNIEYYQYQWVSKKMEIPIETVKHLIDRWIYKEPLKYINKCRYSGIEKFLEKLEQNKIIVAFFSDYPAHEKLKSLNISSANIFCSTDKEIDELKPSSKGLEVISEKLGIPIENCFLIGDRDDRDGKCAHHLNMPYIIISRNGNDFFENLWP